MRCLFGVSQIDLSRQEVLARVVVYTFHGTAMKRPVRPSWQLLGTAAAAFLLIAASGLSLERRHFLASVALGSSKALLAAPQVSHGLEPNGLGNRLLQRDPSILRNSVFHRQTPGPQVYPPWMRGAWKVTSTYGGYLFPSKAISRQTLTQDFVVPGFQKCSIAQTADVGKESVTYAWTIDPTTGWEDRTANFQQAMNAYLGYPAVNQVLYNVRKNPNRISIDFNEFRTVNAERIELFCNARESEEYVGGADGDTSIFVHSEYVRQVTFGTGSTYGVPRQVGTNYAHFWTWKRIAEDQLQGNLLTAAYLDPQDALYFDEPVAPVAVYSHVLQAQRMPVS
jgi:hypothetical protein